MSECTPDHWVLLKAKDTYRVFATFNGSYLRGESWRRSSHIVRAELKDNHYIFYSASGSVYRCHVNNYGITRYGTGIIDGVPCDILHKNTDFLKLELTNER